MAKDTGFPGSDAQFDFSRARRRRALSRRANTMRREPDDVNVIMPFEEVVQALGRRGQRNLGLQTIELDTIVGTVDRSEERAQRDQRAVELEQRARVAELVGYVRAGARPRPSRSPVRNGSVGAGSRGWRAPRLRRRSRSGSVVPRTPRPPPAAAQPPTARERARRAKTASRCSR
ncbi:MAG: hypothetical protein WKF32_00960 [Thermoleophilaceae bacterium]